jgi:hypothetical protein
MVKKIVRAPSSIKLLSIYSPEVGECEPQQELFF